MLWWFSLSTHKRSHASEGALKRSIEGAQLPKRVYPWVDPQPTNKTAAASSDAEGSLSAAAATPFTDLAAWSLFLGSQLAGCVADDSARVVLARLPVLLLAPHARRCTWLVQFPCSLQWRQLQWLDNVCHCTSVGMAPPRNGTPTTQEENGCRRNGTASIRMVARLTELHTLTGCSRCDNK